MSGEAPSNVGSFPNAPGVVTITWDHSGDDVFWFVIELESPAAFWIADRDKRVWSIFGLQPSQTYRFRVCAVHEFDRSCSGFTTVTTFPRPDEPTTEPPPPEASPPLPAFVGSFEPLALPGMLARHRNFLGDISPIGNDLDRADATFRILPADGSGNLVRLEATNLPGHFLRHQHFRIVLNKDDGSGPFRQDSTFRTSRRGPFGWTRLESVNFPGHFIRHQNFEMKIAADDGSALFKADSTWRRLPPPPRNAPPGSISIQSFNFPGRFIRHRNALGFITRVDNDLDRRDATFVIRKALLLPTDPVPPGREGSHEICVSLESVNFPGHFLRHQEFRMKLHQNDGSLLFRQDASFMYNGGNDAAGNAGFSLESINLVGNFVRHFNFELFLAAPDGSDLFNNDASWQPVPSLI